MQHAFGCGLNAPDNALPALVDVRRKRYFFLLIQYRQPLGQRFAD
jgi:hypothetical protein